MRPGKPITFGSLGARLIFGLPGNPVSAMVTFEVFVRPVLLRMAGLHDVHRPRVRARALEPIPNPGPRRGYLRVTLQREGDGYAARLTGEQGSAILRSMVMADGLAVVPGDTTVAKGDMVDVILLR
jgi:molybdopterin molybdotransferase